MNGVEYRLKITRRDGREYWSYYTYDKTPLTEVQQLADQIANGDIDDVASVSVVAENRTMSSWPTTVVSTHKRKEKKNECV